MERWRGKVAVVTGASAGIGLATLKALVSEGMIVIGLARRKDKIMKEMIGFTGTGKWYAKECDVSDEKSVIEAFDYVKNTFKTLHVLVNNAGTVMMNSIEKSEMKDLEHIINTNLYGPLYCYKHSIKLMKENKDEAFVINVSSIAGHKVPAPCWYKNKSSSVNVYAASKFGLKALSETIRYELIGSKIRVTNLSPGFVLTEIFQDGFLEDTGLIDNPHLKPEDIANTIVYVIGTPTHVQISELTIQPLGEDF